ncbi:hypothetical protein Cni_G20784 [Canna indica]|uniref:Embryo defective 1923 n=1 Tax=Canna indica TaxID=4628 RepID=A0AAQ3KPQ9_9LILI|nr:hypothetical protein Cni_G20784 [Canna indica]
MASTALSAFSSLATGTSRPLRAPPFLSPKSRASLHLPRSHKNLPFVGAFPSKPFPSRLRLGFPSRIERGFVSLAAQNGDSEPPETVHEVDESRGQSTMPERFRYLTKEVPDRPVRWPWAVALPFLLYAWRTVLWELTNWKNIMASIMQFLAYLGKWVLAVVFHYIGDLITGFIRCIEFCLYSAKYIYASIVAFAPVPELMRIILFATAVLAIAEASVPDSVNSQPYLLTLAGFIGFGAVKNFIPELLFWFLLFGMFFYSRFIKKKDDVSALLPSAVVLAAVGEPWVRGLVICSYLVFAIFHHSKTSEELVRRKLPAPTRRLPMPLLFTALSIGVHLAAKWVRYRHLTWMIA